MGRARIIMRMRYVGRMRCKGSVEVETERVQQQCHSPIYVFAGEKPTVYVHLYVPAIMGAQDFLSTPLSLPISCTTL